MMEGGMVRKSRLLQTVALFATMVTLFGGASALAQATADIRVDVSGSDSAQPQVKYRRGVVVQMNGNGAAIARLAADTARWVSDGGLNFINVTIDLNDRDLADQFEYINGDRNQPAVNQRAAQRYKDILDRPPFNNRELMVQVSGTPMAFSDKSDPRYKFVCGGSGNFYPVPRLDTADERADAAKVATAVAQWVDYMGTVDIVAGTQEPSHTLGFVPSGTASGCGRPSQGGVQNNLDRFVAWWKPIALYDFPNSARQGQPMQIGAMQLNRGDSDRYAYGAKGLKTAGARTDYYTIQVYGAFADAEAGLNKLYADNRQALYPNERIIIDRYGPTEKTKGRNCDRVAAYTMPAGINFLLGQEAILMNSARLKDFAGYALETSAFSQRCTGDPGLVPRVIKWLQSAPAPLRPISQLPGALKGIALVSKDGTRSGYLALWNNSATDYTVSVTLAGFGSVEGMKMDVLRAGSTGVVFQRAEAHGNVDGISRSGNVLSNVKVRANDFVLISMQ